MHCLFHLKFSYSDVFSSNWSASLRKRCFDTLSSTQVQSDNFYLKFETPTLKWKQAYQKYKKLKCGHGRMLWGSYVHEEIIIPDYIQSLLYTIYSHSGKNQRSKSQTINDVKALNFHSKGNSVNDILVLFIILLKVIWLCRMDVRKIFVIKLHFP